MKRLMIMLAACAMACGARATEWIGGVYGRDMRMRITNPRVEFDTTNNNYIVRWDEVRDDDCPNYHESFAVDTGNQSVTNFDFGVEPKIVWGDALESCRILLGIHCDEDGLQIDDLYCSNSKFDYFGYIDYKRNSHITIELYHTDVRVARSLDFCISTSRIDLPNACSAQIWTEQVYDGGGYTNYFRSASFKTSVTWHRVTQESLTNCKRAWVVIADARGKAKLACEITSEMWDNVIDNQMDSPARYLRDSDFTADEAKRLWRLYKAAGPWRDDGTAIILK